MEQLRTEPWFTESANNAIKKFIDMGNDLRVFEFGSGGSTLWFRKQKNVSEIISIEHDEEWYKAISKELTQQKSKTPYFYVKSDMPYNNEIDAYDKFDIIVIDGRNRVKCMQSAIDHLDDYGILILDNSEREYYNPGIDLFKYFYRAVFKQPKPDKYGFTYPDWTTTIFTRKNMTHQILSQ